MANTDDLRYVRTEQAIRAAFMELVGVQPVNTVTASALCRAAGISRNAFYLHYASVTDLYAALVGELVEDIRTESMASARRRSALGADDTLSAAIVEAFGRHEGLLRALLPSDNGSLAKYLAEGIEDAYVEAGLLYGEHGGSLEHRARCAFAAWAHVGTVSRWIDQTDKPISDALELFEEMQRGSSEVAAKHLLEGN